MHQKFMEEAIKEAEISLKEGGLPIGAVLVKENQTIIPQGRENYSAVFCPRIIMERGKP